MSSGLPAREARSNASRRASWLLVVIRSKRMAALPPRLVPSPSSKRNERVSRPRTSRQRARGCRTTGPLASRSTPDGVSSSGTQPKDVPALRKGLGTLRASAAKGWRALCQRFARTAVQRRSHEASDTGAVIDEGFQIGRPWSSMVPSQAAASSIVAKLRQTMSEPKGCKASRTAFSIAESVATMASGPTCRSKPSSVVRRALVHKMTGASAARASSSSAGRLTVAKEANRRSSSSTSADENGPSTRRRRG